MTEEDSTSIFSYDGDADPDTFSISQLTAAVNFHFNTTEIYNLKKLAEGGFHKVYEIFQDDATSHKVVRVAAPAFPRDKLESEIATLKLIATHTKVPVPKVYAWDLDASNPVDTVTFYAELSGIRGSFSNITDYLQCFLRADLSLISNHGSVILAALSRLFTLDEEAAVARLELGERVIRKVIDLRSVYPGDIPIDMHPTTSTKKFSLRLDDFRLSNIMMEEESGRVTGCIDFEAATIAPLWECALIPRWLLHHPEDPESSYEGGSDESRQRFRALFMEKVGNGECMNLGSVFIYSGIS